MTGDLTCGNDKQSDGGGTDVFPPARLLFSTTFKQRVIVYSKQSEKGQA